jgi:D-glycero-alpha-D-manno-heptose-7-phosphate kinase
LKLKKEIIGYCKTPIRLSLAGGGTDVEPFSSLYGAKVLNFAIKNYVNGEIYSVSLSDQKKPLSLFIKHINLSLNESESRTRSDFELLLEQKLTELYVSKLPFPVSISLRTPVSPGSGLGASSSMVLTAVHLLSQLLADSVNPLDLANKAFNVERVQMGILGGFQDQFASALGGVCYLTFEKGVIQVEKLSVPNNFLRDLEKAMILIDLGVTRSGETIIEKQIGNMNAKKPSTLNALREQLCLAQEMKVAVLEENLTEVGNLLQRAWLAKKEYALGITTKSIDNLVLRLMHLGALGAKLSGAGGGGHMLCLTPEVESKEITIKRFLLEEGYAFRTVEISDSGSIAWT